MKQKFGRKLVLSKETVSNLNNSELNSIRGGTGTLCTNCGFSCPAHCTPPPTLTCLCTHLTDCKGETIVDCPTQP
jgi:hypothetical protein